MTERIETTVLIIGGGPVGLSCAMDLAQRGIDCLLVERGDGVVRLSKMGLVSVRTMEFCRRWGIADRVRDCGFPPDYPINQVFCTSLGGHLIHRIPYPSMRDEPIPPQSPEKRQRCPQLWFDPLLARAVREQDRHATLRYECELERLDQDDDGVTGTARDLRSGSPIRIRAKYAIACDGAGSGTRRMLGIDFEGEVLSYSTGVYFRSPGLIQRHRMGAAERYMLIGPEGTWGNLTVVDGDAYWRLTITGPRDRVEASDFDAEAWLRRCLGDDSIEFEIDAVMPWRRARLVASRFQSGRIFLAGDAAHVTAPNGGFGMNTGIADAIDLGWKIEATLAGWGGPGLLAHYGTERRPAAQRAVDAAATNFARFAPALDYTNVLDDGPAGQSRRQLLGMAFDETTRIEWETLGVVLGYRYDQSPLVVPDGSPAPVDDPINYVQTSRAGHRAPHAWLSPGRSTLDLFGRGFVLMRLGAGAPDPAPIEAAAARCGMPLAVHTSTDPQVMAAYERALVLVRPDGHTAWRGDALPADAGALIDTVRGAA
jgi:2-polyprenyl-6-methoxyphenol hydroxylase-like FAD-dependent oxidoreductase